MNELLHINQLRVSYGGAEVLKGVSLGLKPGRILGLVGESGCGKTTLLRSVIGLLGAGGHITRGRILFEGQDLALLSGESMRRLRGRRLTMIFQNAAETLNPTRTIGRQFLETMRSHRDLSKKAAYAEIGQLMESLDLNDPDRILKSYPFELSGGMVQRVAMALAMVMRPALMLADEPTSALDALVQAQAVNEMVKLRNNFKTSILMISHNMGVVAHMADQIGVMYAGQLVEYGDCDRVLANPLHPYTQSLIAAVPRIDGRLPSGTEGGPPLPDAPVHGCGFAERCDHCVPECLYHQPMLGPVHDHHLVACAQAAR